MLRDVCSTDDEFLPIGVGGDFERHLFFNPRARKCCVRDKRMVVWGVGVSTSVSWRTKKTPHVWVCRVRRRICPLREITALACT